MIHDIIKFNTVEFSEIFLIGNSEEIQLFDLRKKDHAFKFDNLNFKLENFLQLENRDNNNYYFSAIDSINNRTLIFDLR